MSSLVNSEIMEQIRTAISDDSAETAITRFYAVCQRTPPDIRMEWQLTRYLAEVEQPIIFTAAWPAALLARISGACLAFVSAQVSAREIDLPAALALGRPIPMKYRRTLAKAWRTRPNCRCLADRSVRKRFAIMLSQDKSAIGDCLAAEVARDDADAELTAQLCQDWIQSGIYHHPDLTVIESLMSCCRLQPILAQGLSKLLSGYCFTDAETLRLLEMAFELKCWEQVAAWGNRLLSQPLTESQQRRLLCIYLAALAESGNMAEAARLYQMRWKPTDWAYPFPERLLYAFQQPDAPDLKTHLMETAVFTDQTPAWVRLSREIIMRQGDERTLAAWADLYQAEIRDERVLVGFSNALIDFPEFAGGRWRDRLLKRWEQLSAYESYHLTAALFMMRLQPSREEQINIFNKHFISAAPDLPATKQAIRLYLKALYIRRRWLDLRKISESKMFRRIARANGNEEFSFYRRMARLEEIPRREKDIREWLRGWEELISLRLDTEMLMAGAEHFIRLKAVAAAIIQSGRRHDLFEDIKLQWLRRIKAEAERLLIPADLGLEERSKHRERLYSASLEGAYRILTELFRTAQNA